MKPRKPRSRTRTLALGVAAVVVLIALAHHHADIQPTQTPPPTGRDASASAALRQLAALPVLAARKHHPGYQRGCGGGQACSFGPAWTDDTTAPGGHNGCDTRNDILAAQLTHVTHRPGSRCVVTGGVLRDPYTGRTIGFAKAHASAVQIDHMVPLALAWDLGAYAWPAAKRATYANDERLVLLAVSGPANEAKSDSGPSGWMPPDTSYRRTYAARFVAVLSAYHLPVTAPDKTALTTALKGH
jgi:hypothetical protein